MTTEFAASLDGLDADARSHLGARIEDIEEDFYDLLDDIEPTEPGSPDHDALPTDYLEGVFETADAVGDYLKRVDLHWRLDALMAVEDYFDRGDEDPDHCPLPLALRARLAIRMPIRTLKSTARRLFGTRRYSV